MHTKKRQLKKREKEKEKKAKDMDCVNLKREEEEDKLATKPASAPPAHKKRAVHGLQATLVPGTWGELPKINGKAAGK